VVRIAHDFDCKGLRHEEFCVMGRKLGAEAPHTGRGFIAESPALNPKSKDNGSDIRNDDSNDGYGNDGNSRSPSGMTTRNAKATTTTTASAGLSTASFATCADGFAKGEMALMMRGFMKCELSVREFRG
jgi:hypothetical protein